jgi:tryptophan synthase alpha chain
MRPERLREMAALGRPYLYAALRSGITGSHTDIGDDTRSFLSECASGGSKVLGGFGIRTGAQARAVAPHVHAVVAGSVFVEAISNASAAHPSDRVGRDEAIRRAVREVAVDITGG